MSEVKTCFVIAPIGESDSEIRKRSDQVLKHVITPAVLECGFEPIRADQISEPGIITSQIIQYIIDAPLVIADLTDRNPNVFYELALRHAIRKPLVQMISKGEQIPFDVAATRIVMLDHRDLDSVAEAKAEIIRQVNSVISDPSKVDSPISMSLDLQSLKRSSEPEQRSLADVVEAISSMRLELQNIKNLNSASFRLDPIANSDFVLIHRHTEKLVNQALNEIKSLRNKLAHSKEFDENSLISSRLPDITLLENLTDIFFQIAKNLERLKSSVAFG